MNRVDTLAEVLRVESNKAFECSLSLLSEANYYHKKKLEK